MFTPRAPQAPPVSITRGFAQAPHSAPPVFSRPGRPDAGLAGFVMTLLHGTCHSWTRATCRRATITKPA